MRILVVLLVAFMLNGCGGFFAAAAGAVRVRRHFKEDFACSHATMYDWMDGARVEGCGSVAYYWCDDDDHQREPWFKHYGRMKRIQLDGPPVTVFRISFRGDNCVLDHAYSSRLVFAPGAGSAVKATMDDLDRAQLRATASFDGGRIELWEPRLHREYTLLKLFSEDPLTGAVSFTRDGAVVPVVAHQQVAETELHALIPTAQLHALTNFAIHAFGTSYALDATTLSELAKFEH